MGTLNKDMRTMGKHCLSGWCERRRSCKEHCEGWGTRAQRNRPNSLL